MPDSRPSKRFSPSAFMEKLVPLFLIILVLGLLAVIVILTLSMAGIIPPAS